MTQSKSMDIYTNGTESIDLVRFRKAVEEARDNARTLCEEYGDRDMTHRSRAWALSWVLDVLDECTELDPAQHVWTYMGEEVCGADRTPEEVAEALEGLGVDWRAVTTNWLNADTDNSDSDTLSKVLDTMHDHPHDPWMGLFADMLGDILDLRHSGLDAHDRYGDTFDLQAVRTTAGGEE